MQMPATLSAPNMAPLYVQKSFRRLSISNQFS